MKRAILVSFTIVQVNEQEVTWETRLLIYHGKMNFCLSLSFSLVFGSATKSVETNESNRLRRPPAFLKVNHDRENTLENGVSFDGTARLNKIHIVLMNVIQIMQD